MDIMNRINYIDYFKGISIFLVIWVHTFHPFWLDDILVNSFFFFISGLFFKNDSFIKTTKKQINQLLIPFLFFYIISYPFKDIVNNVPLWFLPALIVIRYYAWFITKLPTCFWFVSIALSFIFFDYLLTIDNLFIIKRPVYWSSFYLLGYLANRIDVKNCYNIQYLKRWIIFICLVISILFLTILNNKMQSDYIVQIRLICIIYMLIFLLSLIEKVKLHFLSFIGSNTIHILGLHYLFLKPLQNFLAEKYFLNGVWIGFFESLIVLSFLLLLIPIINKYMPQFLGKKNIIK